ncbi:hypothetical protein GCM10009678_54390 [Actinomadura kijaniata]
MNGRRRDGPRGSKTRACPDADAGPGERADPAEGNGADGARRADRPTATTPTGPTLGGRAAGMRLAVSAEPHASIWTNTVTSRSGVGRKGSDEPSRGGAHGRQGGRLRPT